MRTRGIRQVSKPAPDPAFPTYVVSGPDREWMMYGGGGHHSSVDSRIVASTSGGGDSGSAACSGSGDQIGGVRNFA